MVVHTSVQSPKIGSPKNKSEFMKAIEYRTGKALKHLCSKCLVQEEAAGSSPVIPTIIRAKVTELLRAM